MNSPRFTALVLLMVCAVWPATAQQPATLSSPAPALPIPVRIGNISLGEGVPGPAAQWVEDAVRTAMPSAGLASLSASPLILQLRIISRASGTSDAGMRSITLVDVLVTLELRDATGRGVVAASGIRREGNGRDLSAASSQALTQVAKDDRAIRSALVDIGHQAAAAFEGSCDDVIAAANRMASERLFDGAIGLLMGVPAGAPRCRDRAQILVRNLYVQRTSWQCGTALRQARAERAAGHLEAALDALQYIDPLSPCNSEVTALIKAIGSDAAARSASAASERAEFLRQEWAIRREAIRGIVGLEQQRIAALTQIAEAVLTRRH